MNERSLASELDRVGGQRASLTWLTERWRDPKSLLLRVDPQARLFVTEDRCSLRAVNPEGDFDPQRHILLGLADGVAYFVTEAPSDGPTASLRSFNAEVSGLAADLATTAVAITNWHRADPQCPACGGDTKIGNGGFVRTCTRCDKVQFPRTDSAVIVAVVDVEDRLLLGHQASWDRGRVSLLAGFVEAGESLEQAVHREVDEEAGVRLGEMRYVTSQPWPFPRSIMLGFVAAALGTDVSVDGEEIEHANWFSRDELVAGCEEGRVSLPGPGTIAYRMIQDWLQGRIGRHQLASERWRQPPGSPDAEAES